MHGFLMFRSDASMKKLKNAFSLGVAEMAGGFIEIFGALLQEIAYIIR